MLRPEQRKGFAWAGLEAKSNKGVQNTDY